MTGLYPVAHGVRNNGHHLPRGDKTLAEILKGRGMPRRPSSPPFRWTPGSGSTGASTSMTTRSGRTSPFKTLNAERRAEETFARFSRWLETERQGRFFGWVHFYDPHWPYDPPSPYKEEFAGRPYDGEIAYMDRYVGALLDRLREQGVLERTLVVVAGDHGEGLGDKVEMGHGIFLYEETLRVPLIFHNPAIFPRPRVVESQVRLVDVAPTILEVLGLEGRGRGHEGTEPGPLARGQGAGRTSTAWWKPSIPGRTSAGRSSSGSISGRWKYIQSPRPELYDLESDPGRARRPVSRLRPARPAR